MELDTWVSIAVLLGTGATVCGLLLRAIGRLDHKIDATRDELGGRIDATRDELATTRTELGGRIDATRDELATTRTELIGRIDATRDELGGRIDATREDLRAEFKSEIGGLAAIVRRLDERVYDLATGHRPHQLIVPPH